MGHHDHHAAAGKGSVKVHVVVVSTSRDALTDRSGPALVDALMQTDAAEETRAVMGWALDQILIMLHPIMPFITEEIWGLSGTRAKMLIHADWPTYGLELVDENAVSEMRWVRETGVIETDSGGRPVRGLGMVQDITDRKEAQEQLEIGRSLNDATTDVIVVTNAERQIVTVNPAFVRQTGYTLAEVRGRNPRFLRSGKLPREFYTLMWEEIEKTGSWTGTFVNRRKSGETYEVQNTISTIRNGRSSCIH